MAFIKIANVGDVPAGTGRQIMVNGRALALFNAGGRFYVIDDSCPHRGAPLSEGQMAGTEVVCPWHAARFDVATGAHLCPPARSGVATFPVQLVGDEIQADVA